MLGFWVKKERKRWNGSVCKEKCKNPTLIIFPSCNFLNGTLLKDLKEIKQK